MSLFSDNPELYDEIIVEEMIKRGLVSAQEAAGTSYFEIVEKNMGRPDFFEIALAAEQSYFGSRIDQVMAQLKGA